MSRYGYEYALTPSHPTGWRNALSNVLMVGTIVAVSAISGAVVSFELMGPTSAANAPTIAAKTVPAPAPMVALNRAPAPAARVVTPAPRVAEQVSTPASVAAGVEQAQALAIIPQEALQQPFLPTSAPLPQAASAVPVASANQAAAPVSESELTFTQGYARRRAVQQAAEAARPQVARVESESQIGRPAVKAKPKTNVARANAPQDQAHVADARDTGSLFDRFLPRRQAAAPQHQAMAYGDPRASRHPQPQSGGLFANSPGGFFGGLF